MAGSGSFQNNVKLSLVTHSCLASPVIPRPKSTVSSSVSHSPPWSGAGVGVGGGGILLIDRKNARWSQQFGHSRGSTSGPNVANGRDVDASVTVLTGRRADTTV